MELAFLLRAVGTKVVWITNQKPTELDEVVYSLEQKMMDRGVQVKWGPFLKMWGKKKKSRALWSMSLLWVFSFIQELSAKGREAVDIALKADLVILNTAVAGKWLDAVLKENVPHVVPKILWWIHEMRGHYFKLEYVKHLPHVAGAMIDSHVTAEYWKSRTHDRLGYVDSPHIYYNSMLFCFFQNLHNILFVCVYERHCDSHVQIWVVYSLL